MISPLTGFKVSIALPRRSRSLGWIEISLLALVLTLSILGLSRPSAVQAASDAPQLNSPIYIPMASNGLTSHVDSVDNTKIVRPACELSAEENAVLELAKAHPEQGRPVIDCHSILAQVARAKAADMATRNYVAHTDPDGNGPNALVWNAGYLLPDWYPNSGTANNIESIGAGYETPQAVFNAWMNSKYHRIHVLATDSFYASQHQVAIGHYYDPNSTYKHYWVFLSAPDETQ